jgi:hypothetical protein
MKNIGKPCAVAPHARFDEGGQVKQSMARLLRHRQTKGAATAWHGLRNEEPVLYATFFHSDTMLRPIKSDRLLEIPLNSCLVETELGSFLP